MGDLNIEAGGNVKVVGSDIASLGDTNIKVGDGKEVKFEAGKNTYEHSSNSITVGVTSADASAGAGGASAKASWNHVDGGSTEVITGDAVQVAKDSQNKNGKLGKNYMDSLTSAQTTVGVSVKNSSEKSTTWSKGNVSTGGNLNITSGSDDNSRGTVDIGGADFTTGGDFNITAKQIDTTKYTDVTEKTNSDFSLGVKVSNSTTSSIADAVNKGMQIAETAADPEKSLNAGLTAAQVAGTATNLIFGDLAANTSTLTGELGYSESSSKHTKENETVIQSGGKINFKTTDGDINLNGVQMKGNEVVLDADEKHNININSAKETYTENSFSINASGGVTASAGVGAIDGGNAQLGVTGNASFSKSDVNNEYSHGSVIEAGNVELKGKDVNLKGSNIIADNLHTELKGNVNVTTETDKYDESRIEAWAGVDGSLGVASNTIGTGDLGVSAGGGQIYKKGDVINNQAGIVVKNNITGTIEGDLNLKGGVFGSETGNANGNLTIGGNVNVEDVKSNLEAGGAIVGGNIGSKGGGVQGEVGDVIDLEKTAKGTVALNPGNTQIGGDVTVNGESAQGLTRDNDPLKGVNTDLSNSLTTDKDVYEGGGTFSGTASVPSFGSKKKGDKDKPIVDSVDGNSTKVITGKVEGGPSYPEINTSPQPNKGVVDKGGSNVPELKLPTTEPPVKLPVPEIKKPDTVDGGSIKGNVVTEPNTKKTPEVTGGNGAVKGNTENVAVGGYVKNPETGKWESTSGSKPGAILTGGAITNKNALDGFQKGAESLNGTKQTPEVSGGENSNKTPVVSGGQYVKNPETGKWESASGSKPGAILTGGAITNKNALDGFQKGAESLNGTKQTPEVSGGENSNKTPVVSGGQYVKNPETGKWESASGSKPGAILTGGAITNKNALDGFQKGAESLNKGKNESAKGSVVTELNVKKTPEVTGGNSSAKGNAENVTVGENAGGYVKNPETGKWESTSGSKPGAILTGGAITNKNALDGFQKGAESLNKGKNESAKGSVVTELNVKKTPEVTGGNSSAKGNAENVTVGENAGGYVKNPETGKWESTSGSKPGAILTGGAITNKNALDGFQKGAESLNKGKNEGAKGSVVTESNVKKTPEVTGGNSSTKGNAENVTVGENAGGYVKNSETGKWESASGSNPGAILTGGAITNKNALDGFQKGAESLNKGKNESAKGSVVTELNVKKTPEVTGGNSSAKGNAENVTVGENAGGYVKNPETGKWESTSGSKPGAILTGGAITNKNALDGFQKGAESLNKGKNEGAKGSVVTESNVKKTPEVTGGNSSTKGNAENVTVGENAGGYVKNSETGKWESASGSNPGAILTGGAITNKNALDGFQKGAESLNPRNGKLVK
nr:hemagglutinin repeat-containing protein [Fusobacterium ulcerans]